MSSIAQFARFSARQIYKQAAGPKKGLGRIGDLVSKPKVKPKPKAKPKVKPPESTAAPAAPAPLETPPRTTTPAGEPTPGAPSQFGVDPSTQPGYRYPDVDEVFPRDQRTQFGGDEVAPAGQQTYDDYFGSLLGHNEAGTIGQHGEMWQTGAADSIPPLIRRPKYKEMYDPNSAVRKALDAIKAKNKAK